MSINTEENRKVIYNFFNLISKQFNIDEKKLQESWNKYRENDDSKDIIKSIMEDVENVKFDQQTLAKYTVNQLKGMCKERKLVVGGKKQDLIDRLLNDTNSTQTKLKETKKVVNSTAKNFDKKEEITIIKNKWNNYEHSQTKFVFNKNTKKVIGKQEENGEVKPLTDEDIEVCKQYKFDYEIPENLDLDEDEIIEELIEDDDEEENNIPEVEDEVELEEDEVELEEDEVELEEDEEDEEVELEDDDD